MEKIDILLWVVAGGLGAQFSLLIFMWGSLNRQIEFVNSSLSLRIEKLDEKMTDIDRRLCRLEGAFSAKDCCKLNDNSQMRKAE
jgi:hypothetical protein